MTSMGNDSKQVHTLLMLNERQPHIFAATITSEPVVDSSLLAPCPTKSSVLTPPKKQRNKRKANKNIVVPEVIGCGKRRKRSVKTACVAGEGSESCCSSLMELEGNLKQSAALPSAAAAQLEETASGRVKARSSKAQARTRAGGIGGGRRIDLDAAGRNCCGARAHNARRHNARRSCAQREAQPIIPPQSARTPQHREAWGQELPMEPLLQDARDDSVPDQKIEPVPANQDKAQHKRACPAASEPPLPHCEPC
jgi:hypothetical protein